MKQFIFGSVLCCTALTSGYALAACTQTPDCETMGYIYTADECPNGGVKCPFDISKYFCFDPSDTNNSFPDPSVPTEGTCCGYIDSCGYAGGTSSANDTYCQSYFGRSCYDYCKSFSFGFPDCTDMQASCRASGGTPVFQDCYDTGAGGLPYGAWFNCE